MKKQEVSFFATATGLAVVLSRQIIQCVPECRSPGGKADGA